MWHSLPSYILVLQLQPFYPTPELYWGEHLPHFVALVGFLTFSLVYDILALSS
jgi:hypothetical protein